MRFLGVLVVGVLQFSFCVLSGASVERSNEKREASTAQPTVDWQQLCKLAMLSFSGDESSKPYIDKQYIVDLQSNLGKWLKERNITFESKDLKGLSARVLITKLKLNDGSELSGQEEKEASGLVTILENDVAHITKGQCGVSVTSHKCNNADSGCLRQFVTRYELSSIEKIPHIVKEVASPHRACLAIQSTSVGSQRNGATKKVLQIQSNL